MLFISGTLIIIISITINIDISIVIITLILLPFIYIFSTKVIMSYSIQKPLMRKI